MPRTNDEVKQFIASLPQCHKLLRDSRMCMYAFGHASRKICKCLKPTKGTGDKKKLPCPNEEDLYYVLLAKGAAAEIVAEQDKTEKNKE